MSSVAGSGARRPVNRSTNQRTLAVAARVRAQPAGPAHRRGRRGRRWRRATLPCSIACAKNCVKQAQSGRAELPSADQRSGRPATHNISVAAHSSGCGRTRCALHCTPKSPGIGGTPADGGRRNQWAPTRLSGHARRGAPWLRETGLAWMRTVHSGSDTCRRDRARVFAAAIPRHDQLPSGEGGVFAVRQGCRWRRTCAARRGQSA